MGSLPSISRTPIKTLTNSQKHNNPYYKEKKMNPTTYIRPLILGGLSLLLLACGGGSDNDDGNNNPPTVDTLPAGEITGQIIDGKTGQPLAAAIVSVEGLDTTTASDGSYILQGISTGERIVVSVSKAGFANQSKIVRLTEQYSSTTLPVSLLPVSLTQTFDPNTNQTLTVENTPASVSIPASSLVQNNGSAPDGNVTVNLTVIDPTIDIGFMPGDMLTDVGNGSLSPIESFGAITVTFTDASGNNLNLSQGSTSTIRIPLADKSGSPPASIPLYFYDGTAGIWIEEGVATLILDATNSYYEGTVNHFSTWNADYLYPQVQVHGCVKDSSGALVTGVSAISTGDDYSGQSSAYTDTSGNFSIIVKPDSSVLIHGIRAGIKTNTVLLETTASEQTMDECLLLPTASGIGDTAISIKLSWGNTPFDLDAYLNGPGNMKVYYIDQGSLTDYPFSQLDVDDTNSFGPEVITIFKFPEPGVYRYSVHNYSETFEQGITGSPTRVELNIEGNISLYTPPAGEGSNITWNVFDLVVDENAGVIVTPINTWSEFEP